jgi:hypothetical protein
MRGAAPIARHLHIRREIELALDGLDTAEQAAVLTEVLAGVLAQATLREAEQKLKLRRMFGLK